MNRVIDILRRRDGITEAEAKDLIKEALEQINESNYEYNACEDIMMDVLGLEMDYIHDILM